MRVLVSRAFNFTPCFLTTFLDLLNSWQLFNLNVYGSFLMQKPTARPDYFKGHKISDQLMIWNLSMKLINLRSYKFLFFFYFSGNIEILYAYPLYAYKKQTQVAIICKHRKKTAMPTIELAYPIISGCGISQSTHVEQFWSFIRLLF